MNDAPKRHEPCPWCGEDEPAQFSVMGWPRPQSPDWLVVVCSMCQAQGPTVPRVKDESRDEWVNWAWELWDARYDDGPSTVDGQRP